MMVRKISMFYFEVVYIPGSDNVVANALSRLYSNDSPGTEHANTEFTQHDMLDNETSTLGELGDNVPILSSNGNVEEYLHSPSNRESSSQAGGDAKGESSC